MPLRLRRWFRFSLRTLLVLTTLICIWLGLQVNRASRQRRAIEKLESLDAYSACFFAEDIGEPESDLYESIADIPTVADVDDPLTPQWMIRLLGEDYFQTLVGVQLQDDEFGFTPSLQAIAGLSSIKRVDFVGGDLLPEDVRLLASLRGLRSLHCTGMDEASLSELAKLTHLETLSLNEASVDPGPFLAQLTRLRRLAATSYVELELIGGQQDAKWRISDTLASLGGLQRLEDLRLTYAKLSGAAIDTLNSLENLRRLELADAKPAEEAPTSSLNLRRLENLSLSGATLDDRGLALLGSLPALETLDLSDTNTTDAELAHLARLPRLRFLKLNRTQVRGNGLVALAACPLDRLELSDCPLSADQLGSLGQLRSLRELVVGDCVTDVTMDFGDRELGLVAQLPNLEMLDLRNTKVTPKGLEALTRATRLERLGLPVSVAVEGLPWLQKLPRLKHLKVDHSHSKSQPLLESQLPGCTVSHSMTMWLHFERPL